MSGAGVSLRAELGAELAALEARDLLRSPRGLESAPGPRVLLDGRPVLLLGSNDYLGLAAHPEVRAAAAEAAARWGAGSSGSRLTTGTRPLHEELEAELAGWKGTEDALLFSSGYLAAVGTIPALAGRGDLVLSDALNHASLIDGCRLSRAEVRVYRHGDAAHARELLADRGRFRRALVVTDGVFSMDGDLAPLPELCDACETAGAWLLVDDAHGGGVLGPTGAGTAEHLGVTGRVPIQMGTLSKALGAEGGFIAGCSELIRFLRSRARSYIYSTAPAPPAAAAAREALRILRAGPERRRRLHAAAASLRDGLGRLGLEILPGPTPIIPVILGSSHGALRASRALEEAGAWVPAIRPPTVPEGTARLRVSVTADHGPEHVEEALAAFRRAALPGRGAGP